MLRFLGKIYERELEEKLKQYPQILEPLLIAGMAGFIGVAAVGLLLPVFEFSLHIQ
jgi:type II secretory pathway component PulF